MTDSAAKALVTAPSGTVRAGPGTDRSGRRRILHIVESLETGGMERMVANLAKLTDRQRFDVHVLCLKRLGPLACELEAAGITVHRFAGSPGFRRYVAFIGLARDIRALAPDVVHSHNSPALFFGATAARIAGVPRRVHTEHGRRFPDARRYMLAEHIISYLLDHYVCVSDKTRDDVARFEGISAKRLEVVPNGVPRTTTPDPETIAALRHSLGVSPVAPVIGAVGRLVAEKDYEGLLNAFAGVRARVRDAQLIIVGEGPLRASLEQHAVDLGVEDSVHFTGLRADVSALYHTFDVFVMSSVSEGLPLALLEAMASARPIVATRVGGIPDALDSGAAGVLVQPSVPSDMADALIDLLLNRSRAHELGRAARACFHARYDISIMVGRYQALYDGNGMGR